MQSNERSGKRRLSAAPLNSDLAQEEYVTTLHPEGSSNSIQYDIDKRRRLVRPEIDFKIALINLLIPLFVFFGLCWWNVFYASILLGVYIVIRLRRILIFFIRLYQRYAPENMRVACVFVPSCSEYMRLSLLKYGVIRGVKKGFNRLLRCHHPNGGDDYP